MGNELSSVDTNLSLAKTDAELLAIARTILKDGRRQLASVDLLDQIVDRRHKTRAMEQYISKTVRERRVKLEAQNTIAELRLRQERKIGQMLAEMDLHPGGRPQKNLCDGPIGFPNPKLSDMGIRLWESSWWQTIGRMPITRFDQYFPDTNAAGGEVSTRGVWRLAKILLREAEIEAMQDLPILTPEGLFDVIVVDPPWPYGGRYSPDHWYGLVASPYPEMNLEEIAEIELPAADDCMLWLWTTNTFLHEAFHILEAWQFERKSILTWVKGGLGIGYWLRNRTEHCLLAIRGRPFHQPTNETTVIHARRREHSRKPDEFYEMVDRLCRGRKLDYFSREPRPGWAQCGNEPDKFVYQALCEEPAKV